MSENHCSFTQKGKNFISRTSTDILICKTTHLKQLHLIYETSLCVADETDQKEKVKNKFFQRFKKN